MSLMTDNLQNLHSREIDEIIGRIPNWFIRYGICLFFVLISIILIMAAKTPYPDKIVASAYVIAKPSLNQIVLRDCKRSKVNLNIFEGKNLKAGDVIAIVTDPDSQILKFVRSPCNGRIYYTTKAVTSDTLDFLFWVLPDSVRFFAQVEGSAKNFTRVKSGQLVTIDLETYPKQQVGFIRGKIMSVVPSLDLTRCIATVSLDMPYMISDSAGLNLKSFMLGKAEIYIDNMSLLSRITGSLHSHFLVVCRVLTLQFCIKNYI